MALAVCLAPVGIARAETASEGAERVPALRKLPWERDTAMTPPAEPAHAADRKADEDREPAATSPAVSAATPASDTVPEAASKTDTASEEPAQQEPEIVDGPPVPAHPTVAIIRNKLDDPKITKDAADEDVAALQAFYRSWGEPPLWITKTELSEKGQTVLTEIGKSEEWGLDPDAFTVPEADVVPATDEAQALAEITLDLAILKYARRARGDRHVPSEVSDLFDQSLTLHDPKIVMAGIASSESPDNYLQSLHPSHEQFERLRKALIEARSADEPNETDIRRLVINMERWRWMPEELGPFYVWLNTPSFMLYVVKDGETVFEDKTLVGTIGNPTPVFSAGMKTVVFNPDWIAPPTVLKEKFWPALKRKSFNILKSNKISVSYRGKRIDPAKIDWRRTNIHKFTFRQKAGPKNVLGKAKFLYPNKHIVYMHDTLPPRRKIFKKDVRAIGYGCVRMAKPQAFAAVMLAEDQDLPRSEVKQLWDKSVNKSVTMEREPPVHTTYFTAVVDKEGKVSTFKDLYGLDRKHATALFDSAEGFPKPPPEKKTRSRSVASSAPSQDTGGGGGFTNSLGFGD